MVWNHAHRAHVWMLTAVFRKTMAECLADPCTWTPVGDRGPRLPVMPGISALCLHGRWLGSRPASLRMPVKRKAHLLLVLLRVLSGAPLGFQGLWPGWGERSHSDGAGSQGDMAVTDLPLGVCWMLSTWGDSRKLKGAFQQPPGSPCRCALSCRSAFPDGRAPGPVSGHQTTRALKAGVWKTESSVSCCRKGMKA